MTKTKWIFRIIPLIFLALNLVSFLMFYIPNFVFEVYIVWLEYLRDFYDKFIEFIIPTASATALLVSYYIDGMKKTLIRGIFFALPRAIYLLPYYYLYYLVYAYDSIESITLSALVTLFGISLFYGMAILLFITMRFFARLPALMKFRADLPVAQRKNTPKELKRALLKNADGYIGANLINNSFFDFNIPASLGVFAGVFAMFLISISKEIYNTVDFLIEYAGYYYPEEIIYITACHLFLLAVLLVSQIICCLVKNLIAKINSRKESE